MDYDGNYTFACQLGPEMTDSWADLFSYYANGPLLAVVIAVGLFGNILSLLTLSRPKNRLPQINQYLIALSIWDTALIASAFFVYNFPYLVYGNIVTHGPYVLVYPFWYTLSCASYMGSIWMVMISAVDRFVALCYPLTHRIYVSGQSRTKSILTACSLSCLVFNAPKYLEMSLGRCWDAASGSWMTTVTSSGLRNDPVYWICYKIIGGLLFYSAVPFCALTYLSARVSYEVRRLTRSPAVNVRLGPARRSPSVTSDPQWAKGGQAEVVVEGATLSILRRHSVTPQRLRDDPQQALNCMLVAVLMKFLICHSLPTVLDIWESSLGPRTPFVGPVVDALVDTSNLLVVLNSSVNVFIYTGCSRRFRQDAKKLLLRLSPVPITGEQKLCDGTYTNVQNSRNRLFPGQLSALMASSSAASAVQHSRPV